MAASRPIGAGMTFLCLAGAAEAGGAFPDKQLELGGHVELTYEHLRNLDLDQAEADDGDLLDSELEIELLFTPSDWFDAYTRVQAIQPFDLQGGDEAESAQLLLNEAFVTISAPASGLSLRLGRQLFEDERQWLYDAELDAIRARYIGPQTRLELSASGRAVVTEEDLLNSTSDESITNYILYGLHSPTDAMAIGAFAVVGDDRSAADSRAALMGVTSRGDILDRLSYWADAALLRGEKEGGDLRGYAFDLLARYRFDPQMSTHVVAGYGFGSGDPGPTDSDERGFRQTGLQDNEARLGGVAAFKYYGELFDPELSNLSVLTVGVGVRPREKLSVDLLYHRYRQDEAAETIRSERLEADATGESRQLGDEIDLVVGFEPGEHVDFAGFVGWFMPGSAFEQSDDALLVRFEIELGL